MTAAPSAASPHPTPERIMQMVWGFSLPLVLQTAVRTGIFDAAQQQPATAAELAAKLGLQPRGVRMLVDTLIRHCTFLQRGWRRTPALHA